MKNVAADQSVRKHVFDMPFHDTLGWPHLTVSTELLQHVARAGLVDNVSLARFSQG